MSFDFRQRASYLSLSCALHQTDNMEECFLVQSGEVGGVRGCVIYLRHSASCKLYDRVDATFLQ